MARRVHSLKQVPFQSFKTFNLSDDFTHIFLTRSLGSTNAFCHVYALGKLTLFGLVAGADTTLPHCALKTDKLVLLGTLILNQIVLKGHFTLEIYL